MNKKKPKKKKRKLLRILAKTLLGFLIFFILLILFIRSSWGQNIIIQRAVSYISEKTETKISVEKLYLTFSGNVYLKGLYVEDRQGDTLVYSKKLEADVPFLPIIRRKEIAVNLVNWEGFRANVIRKDSLKGFNYQFLTDAFASEENPEETEEAPQNDLQLRIGKINLSDFHIVFRDDVTGMDTQLTLGELQLQMKEIDLQAMRFHVAYAEISDTEIRFLQTLTVPESEESTDAALPFLTVDALHLKSVKADYQSIPDGIAANVDISSFLLELPKADLAKKEIDITKFELHDSGFLVEMTNASAENEIAEETEITENPADFSFPDWSVAIGEISLLNNRFAYFVNGETAKTGVFNPNALEITEFQIAAQNISLKDDTAQAELKSLRFNETSGIVVKDFGFLLNFDNNRLSLSGIDIHINDNSLKGNIALQYDSVNDLINQPETAKIAVSLPGFQLSAKDAFLFQPELKQNDYVAALSKRNVSGSLDIQGSLSFLQIPTANVNWGQTSISAKGLVKHPLDTEKMEFDFPQLTFKTNRNDALLFVNEEETGISIPENIALNANFKGKTDDISAKAILKTPEGEVIVEGGFSNTDALVFQTDLEIINLNLGKILQNEQLGELNLVLSASGNGADITVMDAELNANIENFSFNEYEINNLQISGELKGGKGNITSAYKDENIDIDLNTFVRLDSVASHIIADIDLRGINLKALGLTDSDIRSTFKLHADFKGNADKFVLSSQIEDGLARYDGQTYLLGNFNIDAFAAQDTTSLDISSKIIQTKLRSNAHPQQFAEALQNHFQRYVSDSLAISDTIQKPVELQLELKIAQAPILNDVFLSGLERLDTISFHIDFEEKQQRFFADMQLPYMNYNGSEVENFIFRVNSDEELLNFNLGFDAFTFGPAAIKETSLKGSLEDKTLFLDFASFYEDEKILNLHSEISFVNDSISFHINPKELIINKKEWNLPESNRIVYTEKYLDATDFSLSREGQLLEISNKNPNIEKEHIDIRFENFRLSDFLNYFNPEQNLARGRLNGDLIIEDPFGSMGLLAELQIEDLQALEIPLGTLSLDAKALDNKQYDFNLSLKDGDIDLDLKGGYTADETAAVLDLDLVLNAVQLKAAEKLSAEQITDAEGFLSGKFKVNGTTAEPQYEGNLDFNNVAFNVGMLNALFKISDESIKINNRGIYLDTFSIQDENNNTFTIDGAVLTEDITNPAFDIQLKAKDFSVLNSTEEDNDLFYGTASFDIDAKLTGNLNMPELKMRLDLHPSTNVTYVMAESNVEIEERDGTVLFVNRERPDDILTKANEEAFTISGFAIDALISVKENATFNVILDKQTGDNLQISGEGDLNVNVYPNGRTTLTGRYEIKKGHFEMNLYNLVKRRFEIAEGSNIAWAGDPMDAALDIRAVYKVETSASALMAAQTSGADASQTGRFRQRLPFLVYLNVGGEMMQPELSFSIDMPENERGAIGGQVYGRVQQVNQQEDEKNRQVFSLLVLNRFFPDSGSDGSGGGTAAIARDNLNQALSDQLNALSGKLLGNTGIELDFGLDSYTDYQGAAPQDRTQLDVNAQKRLFDDRLILSVGSEIDIQGSNPEGESTPVIGNVSIEYLLTEDGKFRLKGFRRNQYENVIDGQLIINGIALIFSREFNKYSELWKREIKEAENENKKKEEDE